jgi:hypothetical protein
MLMAGADPAALEALPWRGEPGGRPALPVPPEPMPLRLDGRWRKRWRYVAAFDPGVMLCAAVIEVGPLRESFWALWDREGGRLRERTRLILPLRGGEVELDGPSASVRSHGVEIELELGDAEPVECACRYGEGGYAWTRKRAGMSARGKVRAGELIRELDGRGVDDESAGYHPRRTSWLWSAGIGRSSRGAEIAWNLVSGINDPERSSERAIWVDGAPLEPDPVEFEGLDAIRFADGSRIEFTPEAGRESSDGIPLLIRSSYEAPFGTFAGSLAGVELTEALGVMERHDALW